MPGFPLRGVSPWPPPLYFCMHQACVALLPSLRRLEAPLVPSACLGVTCPAAPQPWVNLTSQYCHSPAEPGGQSATSVWATYRIPKPPILPGEHTRASNWVVSLPCPLLSTEHFPAPPPPRKAGHTCENGLSPPLSHKPTNAAPSLLNQSSSVSKDSPHPLLSPPGSHAPSAIPSPAVRVTEETETGEGHEQRLVDRTNVACP